MHPLLHNGGWGVLGDALVVGGFEVGAPEVPPGGGAAVVPLCGPEPEAGAEVDVDPAECRLEPVPEGWFGAAPLDDAPGEAVPLAVGVPLAPAAGDPSLMADAGPLAAWLFAAAPGSESDSVVSVRPVPTRPA